MKAPDWWYRPVTWGSSVTVSLIGSLTGFILWIGMILFEKYEKEIRNATSYVKGFIVGKFKKLTKG